jgi:malate dehydrogenase
MRDEKKVLPCAAYLQGEYGISGVYLGVPVKLGRGGVEQIVEIELTPEERMALERSAEAVRELFRILTV